MAKNKLLRIDPTKTTLLRKQFAKDMKKRFVSLSKAVTELFVKNDVLGYKITTFLKVNAENGIWKFLTDEEKLNEFKKWLQAKIDSGVLTKDGYTGEAWLAQYLNKAYEKGAAKSFKELHKADAGKGFFIGQGNADTFVKDFMRSPVSVKRLKLIYTRSFSELKGVSDTMSQQMSRVLANGLLQGANPSKIAREMVRTVENLTKARALVITRTEIIHAHAEGQLDSYERQGIEEVGAEVEWSTAGDDAVCPKCESMEGKIFTIVDARGLIPLHPSCRCSWSPIIRDDEGNLLD